MSPVRAASRRVLSIFDDYCRVESLVEKFYIYILLLWLTLVFF